MGKSLLIKIHLYCGLFTLFYLIAFGLSSIILNHDIKVDKSEVTSTWNSNVQVDPILTESELAESVRDQLGLMGWLPRWEFKKDSVSFSYRITHLGRNSHIDLDLLSGDVQIGEAPKGFLAVFHGLHFFNGQIPNAPFFLRTWAVYQWLTLLTMLVSLIVGLWLWLKYHYQRWEGLVFGGLLVATVIIMMLI